MIEYTDQLGQIHGVFSLLLIIVGPVVINRLLKVKYPLALVTLALFVFLAIFLDRLIFNWLFDYPDTGVGALDGLFSIIIPLTVYGMALVLDLLWVSRNKRRWPASL